MKLIDDYAYRLKIGISTIPNAGLGAFAGVKTAKGTPVCQYKGDIFMPTDNYSFNVEDGRIVGWSTCRVFSIEEIKERYHHTIAPGMTQISMLSVTRYCVVKLMQIQFLPKALSGLVAL
jgi:hypothetical protein